MPEPDATTPSLADRVTERLAPFLGPFNARVAVKTFAQRKLGLDPGAVTAEHLPALLAALQPTLSTLAGQDAARMLLEKIRREVI
jgi:hypothetical protein